MVLKKSGLAVRIVGWGFIPLPFERRRFRRAEEQARVALTSADAARRRSAMVSAVEPDSNTSLAVAAQSDPLTGLLNRSALHARMTRLLVNSSPDAEEYLWALLVDLDSFKEFNDTRGHAFGDEVLMEVARRLQSLTPPNGMAARVGGDEFIVTFVGRQQPALELAEQIQTVLAQPLVVDGSEATVGASIGVAYAALRGPATAVLDSLLREADTALYKSKSEGRGRYTFFEPSIFDWIRQHTEAAPKSADITPDR